MGVWEIGVCHGSILFHKGPRKSEGWVKGEKVPPNIFFKFSISLLYLKKKKKKAPSILSFS